VQCREIGARDLARLDLCDQVRAVLGDDLGALGVCRVLPQWERVLPPRLRPSIDAEVVGFALPVDDARHRGFDFLWHDHARWGRLTRNRI
jgi:hypothetical protein